jgi:hypothetical protein
MTGINFTASNASLFFVGPEAIPDAWTYVGWQLTVHEYGWWLLIVAAALLFAFIYTHNFVLAIMVTLCLAVNVWWIEYSSWPTVPVIMLRAIFILLIAFVWLYLLQSRKVKFVTSGGD